MGFVLRISKTLRIKIWENSSWKKKLNSISFLSKKGLWGVQTDRVNIDYYNENRLFPSQYIRYVYVIIATTSIEIHVSARRNFETYRDMLRPSVPEFQTIYYTLQAFMKLL